jgi:hypothetical protein
MRKRRAGENTVQENGLSHLIDKLDWRPIPGYPGYEASSCGYIKSCARTTIRRNGLIHRTPNKVLRHSNDSKGYPMVCLYVNKKGHMIFVHRAVYLAHVGSIPKNMIVDHIDGDKENAKASNLQLLTHSKNIKKSYEDAYTRGFSEGYEAALKALEVTSLEELIKLNEE